MPNAAGGGASIQPDGRNDSYRSIVSDLASLIEHVQASVRLIESAIASEAPLGNQEIAGNIIVLDDVTPRYVKANATLSTCNAGLGVALHFLLDTRASRHGTGGFAGADRRPVHLTGRA
jgi:hypothetical protein